MLQPVFKREIKHRTSKKKRIITLPTRDEEQSETKITLISKKSVEAEKQYENVINIIMSSNATPIRCRGGIGYACSFCNIQYPLAKDLKVHTLHEHGDKVKMNFMKGHSLLDFIVKLDITDLTCNLCKERIDDLQDLIEHLRAKHDKKTHPDIKNHIVPFKFDGDEIRCAICHQVFNNFKVLLEHMNVHYNNYVCEICGAGFVNKKIMQTHGYRHRTGVFNCSFCSKTFNNRIKMKDHERAVHVKGNRRNKCGYCGEMFTDYTKKHDHEVKVHGVKQQVLKCKACDKVFHDQRSLTIHTKAYHLMDKHYRKYNK